MKKLLTLLLIVNSSLIVPAQDSLKTYCLSCQFIDAGDIVLKSSEITGIPIVIPGQKSEMAGYIRYWLKSSIDSAIFTFQGSNLYDLKYITGSRDALYKIYREIFGRTASFNEEDRWVTAWKGQKYFIRFRKTGNNWIIVFY